MDKTFDEIDNLFLDYFNENKEVPYSIQNTINHALDSEKKQNSLLEFIKALIITLIGIFTVTGGLVFARKMVNMYRSRKWNKMKRVFYYCIIFPDFFAYKLRFKFSKPVKLTLKIDDLSKYKIFKRI